MRGFRPSAPRSERRHLIMTAQGRKVLVLSGSGGVLQSTVMDVVAVLHSSASEIEAPRRLASSAVEIGLEGEAPDVEAIRAFAHELQVDANLVPAQGREKRILIADMDSTIITVECIDELADYAGLKSEVASITEAAMRGEIGFERALRERVRLLEGLSLNDLATCHAERVTLAPGARTLVRTMQSRGAATALVSGGFTYFASRVASAAGFGIHRANTLLVRDGRLTGEVAEPILGRSAKLEVLNEEVARLGLHASDVLAVGDGANDLDMIMAAGMGVAFNAKPPVAEVADIRLDHSDLTALLALQAIPEHEWRS